MPYELHLTLAGGEAGEVRARLYTGEFSLGRKECHIVLGDDKSIRYGRHPHVSSRHRAADGRTRLLVGTRWRESVCRARWCICRSHLRCIRRSRKHAALRVDPLPGDAVEDVAVVPGVSLCDTSQFGTRVDDAGERVPKGVWTPLQTPCTLRFGTNATAGRLCYVPLVVCGAGLDDTAYATAKAQAAPLGVHVTRAWHDACTLALVPATCGASVAADATTACALYAGAPVVRASWLEQSAGWVSEGKDPVAETDACAVAVTHPTSGVVIMRDAAAKWRSLLQGVTLVFGHKGATSAHAALTRALAPWNATLAWAVRAAGGVACALGGDAESYSDQAATAVDLAAQGGNPALGILLVLPSAGTGAALAALRGTPWERADVSDTGRVLSVLLNGVLGDLRLHMRDVAQAAMPPPPARTAKTAAPAADSDTDDEGGSVQPASTARRQLPSQLAAPRVVVATQSTGVPASHAAGFRPFDAGARAKRDREAAEAMGVPLTAPQPTAPKSGKAKRAAPRGHNAALALALQIDKKGAEPEDEEEEEGEPEYRGTDEYVPLVVRQAPQGASHAAGDVVAPPVPHLEGPNFKRFRKVPVLASSASHFHLIVQCVDADRHMDPEAVEDIAREIQREKAADKMFNAGAVATQKAKAKTKK